MRGASSDITWDDIARIPGAVAWFPELRELGAFGLRSSGGAPGRDEDGERGHAGGHRALGWDGACGERARGDAYRGHAGAQSAPNARIVLLQPEIPENTGNIARTCACTGSSLTLVDPLGFQLSERHLRRAGLDYWDDVAIDRLPDSEAFFAAHGSERFWLFTGHTDRSFAQVSYRPGDWLVFGRESRGIDPKILARYPEACVRIPMAPGQRSLNLANSVAIAVYELLRQTGYPQLT